MRKAPTFTLVSEVAPCIKWLADTDLIWTKKNNSHQRVRGGACKVANKFRNEPQTRQLSAGKTSFHGFLVFLWVSYDGQRRYPAYRLQFPSEGRRKWVLRAAQEFWSMASDARKAEPCSGYEDVCLYLSCYVQCLILLLHSLRSTTLIHLMLNWMAMS